MVRFFDHYRGDGSSDDIDEPENTTIVLSEPSSEQPTD